MVIGCPRLFDGAGWNDWQFAAWANTTDCTFREEVGAKKCQYKFNSQKCKPIEAAELWGSNCSWNLSHKLVHQFELTQVPGYWVQSPVPEMQKKKPGDAQLNDHLNAQTSQVG
jgi:hypothetical protein